MIMLLCHRLSLLAGSMAALLAAVAPVMAPTAAAAATATAAAAARGDGDAAVASGDVALNRGDCGLASKLYRDASRALEQPELAARASSIALACGQYAIAHAIAERWLQFAPGDTAALLALTQAELGSYQVADARRRESR